MKNKIGTKDIHRMLTDKLDDIARQVSTAKAPLYFELSVNTDRSPRLNRIDLKDIFKSL